MPLSIITIDIALGADVSILEQVHMVVVDHSCMMIVSVVVCDGVFSDRCHFWR